MPIVRFCYISLPMQPPAAFEHTFQLVLPFKGSDACLEVCSDSACRLDPAIFGAGSSWVSLNLNCSVTSMAAQWRAVAVSKQTLQYVQLQNILTAKCLHVNSSHRVKAHNGEPGLVLL